MTDRLVEPANAPYFSPRERFRFRPEGRRPASLVGELVAFHGKLSAKGASPDSIDRALGAAAAAFRLDGLNKLVDSHNRYFPIEANLPLNLRREYVAYGGRPWRPEEPYTADRLLALARGRLATIG